MTLDEAIQHAREVAQSGCSECCKEHEMNDILRRFIFDSTHAVRSYVDYTGQTVYERR